MCTRKKPIALLVRGQFDNASWFPSGALIVYQPMGSPAQLKFNEFAYKNGLASLFPITPAQNKYLEKGHQT